jgi:hypothetical protein
LREDGLFGAVGQRRIFAILLGVAWMAAMTVFVAPPTGWTRLQEGHRLVSVAAPHLILEMGPTFQALKPLRFKIADLTLAERRIFVEAGPDHVIKRMVVVQFEHALPRAKFRFRYPPKPPAAFGKWPYRSGAFSFDQDRAAVLAPGKEADHTIAFLKAAGYRVPADWDVARLARVSDPKGVTEVIIFYMEAVPSIPVGPGDPEDGSVDASPARAAALLAHLRQVIRPVEG